MSEQLKPCPFCVGKAEIVNYVEKHFIPESIKAYIKCKNSKQQQVLLEMIKATLIT